VAAGVGGGLLLFPPRVGFDGVWEAEEGVGLTGATPPDWSIKWSEDNIKYWKGRNQERVPWLTMISQLLSLLSSLRMDPLLPMT
jgi:hypothetical protein